MKRPRALDLFCCAGGAAMGLHRAGFEVVGVDKEPQKRYPFEFHQADALTFPVDGFDFIWASPPCQFGTALRTMHNAKEHENLIPATRAKLIASGLPYCIENVEGAREHLLAPIKLCGTMFGLGVGDADLQRHRYFELSHPILLTPQCQHGRRATIGVYGGHIRNRKRRNESIDRGVADFSIEEGKEAMGIDWMTTAELSQAIPPAYSEYLGRHFMDILSERIAA